MIRNIAERFQVPETDNVWCVRFVCGHERILSRSDYIKQVPAGATGSCVECSRQVGAP